MAPEDVRTVKAPPAGIWRVGRNPDPLSVPQPRAHDLRSKRAGNRFDIPGVGVIYFATKLEACFGETLARLRPKPDLAALVQDEWAAASYLRPGFVPRSWRLRRTAIKVKVEGRHPFLDVTTAPTCQVLRSELARGLAALGYDDLDLGLIEGPDRRVTRLIAEWAYLQEDTDGDYLFAGIRYTSRLNHDWHCWAVFPDVELEQLEARPVEHEAPELLVIAELFGLRVF